MAVSERDKDETAQKETNVMAMFEPSITIERSCDGVVDCSGGGEGTAVIDPVDLVTLRGPWLLPSLINSARIRS